MIFLIIHTGWNRLIMKRGDFNFVELCLKVYIFLDILTRKHMASPS